MNRFQTGDIIYFISSNYNQYYMVKYYDIINDCYLVRGLFNTQFGHLNENIQLPHYDDMGLVTDIFREC